MVNREAFLNDLRPMVLVVINEFSAGPDAFGWSSDLVFQGNVRELLDRYPQATMEHVRRGCMWIMKERVQETRQEWYRNHYRKVGFWQWLWNLIFAR